MAYYNGFPQMGVSQFPQNMVTQQMPQNMVAQQMPQNMMPQQYTAPQNNTFIHVQSAAQAREWAIAPNTSVTFIDDNAPYCYTKSMGMSMLEPPVFKRFKLVEEFDEPQPEQQVQEQPQVDMSAFMTKEEFEPYKVIIQEMQKIAKELNGNE